MILPDPSIVPDPLLSRDQWVCWREETRESSDGTTELTKVPYTVGHALASSTDPETWASFDKAYEAATMNPRVDGIGYMFRADSPIVGVDLDKCRVRGEIDDWARDVIDTLDSYTHVSTSGTGLHVFVLGNKPAASCRGENIEIYDRERFFAFTGDHLDGYPTTIEQRNDELQTVWETYVDDEDDEQDGHTGGGENGGSSEPTDLDDKQLLGKARNADYKGDKFERLYDHGDITSYESHSEADSALCCILAWWTGHDHQRIDSLFRDSALMRPKWDESRGSETYGEITISNACSTVTGQYDPDDGDDEFDVDPEAFERPSTTSMKVFSAAMKAVTTDDVKMGHRFDPVDERNFRDVETGESVDVISAVALEEDLIDQPDEKIEGRADWIAVGHAMRWKGATVPEYKRTGGAGGTPNAGWR